MGWFLALAALLLLAAWHWLGETLTIGGLAVAVLALLAWRRTLGARQQWRQMKWRVLLRLRPNEGFASLTEVWLRWGRLAAIRDGGRARPSMGLAARLLARTTEYAVRLGRAQAFRRVYASAEKQVLRLAPPRKGKTGALSDRVYDHPGACLVHETRPDSYFATAGHRARDGRPIHTFNPDLLGGIPSTFRWAMTAGCADPAEALYRAADLVGAAGLDGEMRWWSEKARGALAAAVHMAGLPVDSAEARAATGLAAAVQAAALLNGDMTDVYNWAFGDNRLVQAAQAHPDASPALFGALTELNRGGKTAESVKITMSKSLEWMAVPSLAAMVTGAGAAPFDIPAWLDTGGTIYMISPGGEESPSAPLFRCFAGYAHRMAKRHALHQPGRRLDPGVLFALDEYDKCPVNLASWLADSAGFGIQIDAVIHSTGQLREKLGEYGFQTVWNTTGIKILLGGNHDAHTLRDVSLLCGTMPKGEQGENPAAPVEFITRLPRTRALVINDDLTPAVVKQRMIWRRLRFRAGLNPPPPRLTPAAAAVPAAADGHATIPMPSWPTLEPAGAPETNGDHPAA